MEEDEDCKFYKIEGRKTGAEQGLYFIIPESNYIIFATRIEDPEKININ